MRKIIEALLMFYWPSIMKSPSIPLFQRENFFEFFFNPSLVKHVLSAVEGRGKGRFWISAFLVIIFIFSSSSAECQSEWEQTLAAAKKEGTVVVGIPASSELRTAITSRFKEKFGISVELLSARGPENVTRIITEFKAGVRYFDILVAGGATPLAMVAEGAADDFQQYMILPEVKDPKNWWGGHIWEDNVSGKRQVYAFLCYTSETWWYNSSQAEASEIRSFDDLLNPKWKGRIGVLDPRNPGS